MWPVKGRMLSRLGIPKLRYCSKGPPRIKPPSKLKAYAVKKYVGYIERFELKFETKYPKVYKVYKLFKDGVKDFFNDTKLYYSVATSIWNGHSLTTFSRKELFVYRQMPSDMLRSAPVIIAAPLPLVPYALYPVAYMFPRQLLCRHFWTESQKLEFGQNDLVRHRIPHIDKVFHYMDQRSAKIRDSGKRKLFVDILSQIEAGRQPEIEAIIDVKDLFTTYPFGITHLIKKHKFHVWHLARGLDLAVGSKLLQDASVFHHMDMAIHQEGVHNLSLETLQQCCFARGLDAVGVVEEDLRTYLQMWSYLSTQLDSSSISLMLHSPVLLGRSQQSNRKHLGSQITMD